MAETLEYWDVPVDLPAFDGHFPGRPIVPGVVLLDRALGLAQARVGGAESRWFVDQAKFFHPVGPGERLAFRLRERAGGGLAFSVVSGRLEVATGVLNPQG
jgi:3-hydroxyacyl-[acyl-carrier-protein] dehydratase